MADSTIVVIDEDVVGELPGAADDEHLWAPLAESGWESKPAGLCRGALCIPLPADRADSIVRDGRVDLAALARHRGQAVVHDDDRSVWCFGTPGDGLAGAAASLEAPDFTLPDLEGHLHSLSAERGKKVLLVSWASW